MTFVILMKKIKPVLTEKHHFDNRGELNIQQLLWNFGLTWFWCKDRHQCFPNRIRLYKGKLFNWDFDWWTQTCSCWDKSIWITRFIINDGFFSEFWEHRDCDARHKTTHFSKNFLHVKISRLGPALKVWVDWSWRKVSCNTVEIQYWLSFSVFPQPGDHINTCSSRSIFKAKSQFFTLEKLR